MNKLEYECVKCVGVGSTIVSGFDYQYKRLVSMHLCPKHSGELQEWLKSH